LGQYGGTSDGSGKNGRPRYPAADEQVSVISLFRSGDADRAYMIGFGQGAMIGQAGDKTQAPPERHT
jgi:hypothetical protein